VSQAHKGPHTITSIPLSSQKMLGEGKDTFTPFPAQLRFTPDTALLWDPWTHKRDGVGLREPQCS
jgi:hypothetical protein